MMAVPPHSNLHLVKLAVGVRDIGHLRAAQAERFRREPPLRHRTRNAPRRAAEILAGGSIYWVIAGVLGARQLILDITDDRRDDGTPCTSFVLHPDIIAVRSRRMKPFQGWRYLPGADAPPDAASGQIEGADDLPSGLRRELESLCLL